MNLPIEKHFSLLTENTNLNLSHFVRAHIVCYITLYSIHEVTPQKTNNLLL